MREFVVTALKGFAMGAANVIPGVSGGTIAFITGIYERLITALKRFDVQTLKLAGTGKFREAARRVDFFFLLALGVGGILSIATLAKVLEWGFENHPVLVWAFFFGLIAASIPLVGRMVTQWKPSVVALAVIGCVLAVALVFLDPAQESDNPVYLVLCGVVAICSMIIPGLSGSFVLVLMGNYQLIMLDSVNALTSLDFGKALPVLIPVGMGAVLGLVVLSRVLNYLFKHYHNQAVGLITGFVLGSLAVIWPWKEVLPTTNEEGLIMVKTGERTMEARAGSVEQVKAGLGGEEEMLVSGYGNWHGPELTSGQDWAAFGFMVAGAFLLTTIEWVGKKNDFVVEAESEESEKLDS